MRFRRNAPVVIIVAIAIVISAATFLTSRLFAGLTDAVEADQFRVMQAAVENAIHETENRALARAELISDLPAVKKLFAAGDRAGLLAELAPMFKDQKAKYGAAQAQFHLAPAKSFLRLNDPKKFDDDLTKSRPMVVEVNRLKQPLKGMAIARSGPAIFGIAVMNDETGKHIGSFEVGMDVQPVLANLKTVYGMDLAFFVLEKPLRQFAAGVNKEKLGDQNRVGKYIRFATTNSALMTALASPDDVAVVNEPKNYVREVNGLAHGVVLIPVNNSAGTSLGLIAVSSDFSSSRASVNITLIWEAVLGLLAILFLAGIVIIVLRGFLLRPLEMLTDRFDAVHTGEPLKEIPGAEGFPEELQPFVELFEKIRIRRREAGQPK